MKDTVEIKIYKYAPNSSGVQCSEYWRKERFVWEAYIMNRNLGKQWFRSFSPTIGGIIKDMVYSQVKMFFRSIKLFIYYKLFLEPKQRLIYFFEKRK
jgi:hypothetical protein